jgi:hypothetical protein
MRAKQFMFPCIVVAAVAVSPAAWAATAIGRITYIANDQHHFLLDSSDEYALGPKVDATKLGVAELVRITYTEQNGQRVVTDVAPGPAFAANH